MSPLSPLSPLGSSNNNSRIHSPIAPIPPPHIVMDAFRSESGDDYKENMPPAMSSPTKKTMMMSETNYDYEREEEKAAPEINYSEADAESAASPQQPPSSPFRFDARDDTVDMGMLRQREVSPAGSEGLVGPSPRKRSHSDLHVEEDAEEERRRSQGPAVVVEDKEEDKEQEVVEEEANAEIDFDDEGSVIHHRSFRESGRRDVADSMMEDKRNEGMSTVYQERVPEHEHTTSRNSSEDENHEFHDTMDDSCFSTFSAVPNVDMTMFAKLRGESPTKTMRDTPSAAAQLRSSPYKAVPSTPRTDKRDGGRGPLLFESTTPAGSPTPRKRGLGNAAETPNLLDFTDRMELLTKSSKRYDPESNRYSPRRSPMRRTRESIRSPGKYALLDFEIPPAPTPRSIPTVTPRELETLKSGYLSEISSLKATLSGREAEVASLKQAIADAERRVGEALEEVMNEAARKEALEVEQAEWERRGKEMESVLRSVRDEIVQGELERERLTKKVEEAERCKEQLEGRIVELESQLTAARKSTATEAGPASSDSGDKKTPDEVAKEVQDAVERVARELHTLYKGKHETKVAALKKSYEARWEKRVREAENKWRQAMEENERLKTERDTTMSGSVNPNASMMMRENEEHEAEKHVLEAQIKGLQQEMRALKSDNEKLHSDLKMERAEKGELVAVVDEWLAMQQQQQQQEQRLSEAPSSRQSSLEAPSKPANPEPENFKRSISRSGASGIRPPSTSSAGSAPGERKLGRFGAPASGHSRGNSGSGKSGIAAPTPGRSGIMNSIERMGRGI
ncbi:hypothetical protein C8Q69DRAFT_466000 [Paecilomyces variotii]|uniref:Central kinetochore-associated-domain-containing protein n=1 Tax=Byssochlamys spectabilis TaxID=264951 RepID=A0A443HUE8_BYSSP|nr:hypothetical protein C8Q69DRAFT_466000 [Paecilomyces variotii]RWQ95446.1 hypothetical protein C8Q69DRAFT_466000 [Paecilomyces variotii]